ncbi:hypothetical protein CANCADRAFT_1865 [Tortispora caseinolytica NRRL Y-17796]|uniref:Zn(2)-C6 fungal-type domain-containing protein n=1 Tax=Tortispora caseinolytica NRRL Y-17796 TaxID=767744 RepID=A0A1E4TED8_9ASCO|nr:hypothetical protein CANCADRAFT_1865 [Tortispora caseinolytica NRRL Y-17796]
MVPILESSECRRVGKACQRCRRLKIRCDSVRPCAMCSRARTECLPSVTKASKPRGRVSRVQSLPGVQPPVIAEFFLSSNTYPEKPQTTSTTSVSTITQVATANSTSTHDDQSVSSAQSYINYANSSTQQLSPPTSAPPFHNTAAAGLYNPIPPQSPEYQSLYEENLFMPFTVLEMTRRVFRLHHSEHLFNADTSSFADINARKQHAMIRVEEFINMELPPKHILDLLFANYFDSMQWFMHIIFEQSIREHYERIVLTKSMDVTDGPIVLLLLAMFAVGCQTMPEGQRADAKFDFGTLEVMLIKRCEERFFAVIRDCCLESVQFCIVFGLFHLYYRSPNMAWSIIGAGLRCALAIRLNLEPPPQFNLLQRESWRCCFWALYTADRYCALAFGCPPGFSDNHIFVKSMFCETPQSFKDYDLLEFHKCKQHLYTLSSVISDSLYQRQSSPSDLLSLESVISDLYIKLQEFKKTVPPILAFENLEDARLTDSAKARKIKMQSLSLQSAYDNVILSLHRPFLLVRAGQAKYNFRFDSQETEAFVTACLARCKEAALRIASASKFPWIIRDTIDSFAISFLSLTLFSAGVALCMFLIIDPLDNAASEIRMSIRNVIEAEQMIADKNKVAKEAISVLHDLRKLAKAKENTLLLRNAGPDEFLDSFQKDPGLRSIFNSPSPESESFQDFQIRNAAISMDPLLNFLGYPMNNTPLKGYQ